MPEEARSDRLKKPGLLRRLFKPGSWDRTQVTFDAAAYGPGDLVSGAITAREKVKGRELRACLVYVEQTGDYTEEIEAAESIRLGSGGLGSERQIPFSFRLPADGVPDWSPAEPGEEPYACLYWAVSITAERRFRPDRTERHAVPLATGQDAWTGPHPEEVPTDVAASPKDWDVSLRVDRRTVRRGEAVKALVAIGSPAPDRSGLDVGLICEVHYDEEQSTGQSTTRETRTKQEHEERVTLDPSAPVQEIPLTVPADAPFTYGEREVKTLGPITLTHSTGSKRAVVIEWHLVAREQRRMWKDSYRKAEIQVLP